MVGIKLTRAATGRVASWETEDMDDPVNQVHVLSAALDDLVRTARFDTVSKAAVHLAVSATAIAGLIEEIKAVPKVQLSGKLYRARPSPPGFPPTTFEPPKPQPRNRFNSPTQRALYLARGRSALAAELAQMNPGETYWVQEFNVTSAGLLLPLDPVSASAFPRLNQFMLLAERPRSADPLDPYVSTILLREICESQGISAIEYPTITGAYPTDKSAINVVVINETTLSTVISSATGAPQLL